MGILNTHDKETPSLAFDVIAIGAALVDMIASVERYPADDDEVFVSELKLLSGGAAANTAYACAKLGLKTAFLGKIGQNDAFGKKILEDLESVSVNTSLIKYSNNTNTGSAFVALNQKGDRRIYAYSGAANELSKEDINKGEISATKVIFLSSLRNMEPFLEAASIAKNSGIPVVLNPGMLIIEQGIEKVSQLLNIVDIFILSKREFTSLMGINDKNLDPEEIKKASELLFQLGIQVLIITIGEKGAYLCINDLIKLIPPHKIENIIDTTGAGDAFSAGFLYGFIQNPCLESDSLVTNIKMGNYVAAMCIQKLGARNGLPQGEDLKKFDNILPDLKK
ncbi:MAG: carbohydrate kinase family protein [Promethearchaeota archaeon]